MTEEGTVPRQPPASSGRKLHPRGSAAASIAGFPRRLSRVMARALRAVLLAAIGIAILCVVNIAVHAGLHVCPLHLARVERSKIVPVVYGLPTGELLIKAERKEVALGGCVVGVVASLCPHCGWPIEFQDPAGYDDEERESIPRDDRGDGRARDGVEAP